jgi:hypothetical protein
VDTQFQLTAILLPPGGYPIAVNRYIISSIFIPCLGLQHVVETPFPAIPFGFFLGNIAAVSDEHRESFHQDIFRMENR